MTLHEFSTVKIDERLVIDRSSIVTVLKSRNLRCVIRILFSLYVTNKPKLPFDIVDN